MAIAQRSLQCSHRRPVLVRGKQTGAKAESMAAVAHDARNVVAALQMFSELLAEPGVLSEGCQHYAGELQAVIAAGSALVERLSGRQVMQRKPERAVDDLAAAVERLRGPLAALAGNRNRLEIETLFCGGQVPLSQEALTRILVNLTRNAAEAMPQGGRIRITVQLGGGGSFFDAMEPARTALLCVQDSGPGIPRDKLERIFDAGFSTKGKAFQGQRRGLGLSIVRRLVEDAGGSVRAKSAPGGGARFEVELPLIPSGTTKSRFPADFSERANLEC